MGRKKASEKKDDYCHRLVILKPEKPLKIDVLDKKGKKIPNFTGKVIKDGTCQEQINEIIKVVKESIGENSTSITKKIGRDTFYFIPFNDDDDDLIDDDLEN